MTFLLHELVGANICIECDNAKSHFFPKKVLPDGGEKLSNRQIARKKAKMACRWQSETPAASKALPVQNKNQLSRTVSHPPATPYRGSRKEVLANVMFEIEKLEQALEALRWAPWSIKSFANDIVYRPHFKIETLLAID
jgi:hypothetical protein